ncbi:hypothetical protein RCH23_002358 [Cryobacterium sp. CAN_C3]|nr:hypothetical protein [Cryobacterium sp. CAN_C3]
MWWSARSLHQMPDPVASSRTPNNKTARHPPGGVVAKCLAEHASRGFPDERGQARRNLPIIAAVASARRRWPTLWYSGASSTTLVPAREPIPQAAGFGLTTIKIREDPERG